jgi:anti-repressor protein
MNELTFNFDGAALRTVSIDGEPWFVAADVCVALGIEQTRHALERLDDDERGVVSITTLGGPQKTGAVNESGLYSLIVGSRKPEAKRFKKWVTSEVLPQIRKTGSYNGAGFKIPESMHEALRLAADISEQK